MCGRRVQEPDPKDVLHPGITIADWYKPGQAPYFSGMGKESDRSERSNLRGSTKYGLN